MEAVNIVNKLDYEKILAENSRFKMIFLRECDKENYMKTVILNSTIPKAYELSDYREYVWDKTPEKNEWILCIYEQITKKYCGFCNLRYINSKTPELGISLIPEHQGKNYGREIVTLFMNACSQKLNIEYFVAKVDSKNHQSQRLMEKLCAVEIGREESEFTQAIKMLQIKLEQSDIINEINDSYIIVYKLG